MRQPNAPSQDAYRPSTATPNTGLPVQAAPPIPISDRRLLVYVFLVAILVLLIAILCSIYADQFAAWFGFGADPLPPSSIATPVVIYQQSKTLWDWLQLLLVPLVLVLGGFWLTRMENRTAVAMQQQREQAARAAEQRQAEQQAATEEARRKETERIEEERRKEGVRLEEERAQDATLQAYLDKMTELLLDYKLRKSKEGDEVRSVARARTVPVLRVLDAQRTATVAQFLVEAGLVQETVKENGTIGRPIISLQGARLEGADLSEVQLEGVELNGANLSGANLSGANLNRALLFETNLTKADLRGAILDVADLFKADLRGAHLDEANLFETSLREANLQEADLRGANIEGADFTDVKNLDQAILDDDQRILLGLATNP